MWMLPVALLLLATTLCRGEKPGPVAGPPSVAEVEAVTEPRPVAEPKPVADMAEPGPITEGQAIAEIEKLGGKVTVVGTRSPRILVTLSKRTDDTEERFGLRYLKGLSRIDMLSLVGTHITDADLQHLKGLTDLKELWFIYTQVTDSGLEHLRGLTNLRELWLDGT